MPATTIRIPPKDYKEFTNLFNENKKILEKIGIDSISKLYRWCANEGKPSVETKIKKLGET